MPRGQKIIYPPFLHGESCAASVIYVQPLQLRPKHLSRVLFTFSLRSFLDLVGISDRTRSTDDRSRLSYFDGNS